MSDEPIQIELFKWDYSKVPWFDMGDTLRPLAKAIIRIAKVYDVESVIPASLYHLAPMTLLTAFLANDFSIAIASLCMAAGVEFPQNEIHVFRNGDQIDPRDFWPHVDLMEQIVNATDGYKAVIVDTPIDLDSEKPKRARMIGDEILNFEPFKGRDMVMRAGAGAIYTLQGHENYFAIRPGTPLSDAILANDLTTISSAEEGYTKTAQVFHPKGYIWGCYVCEDANLGDHIIVVTCPGVDGELTFEL